ncbi:NAD(P)H-dependent oxidoreductase [Shewanella sp. D64]|uniref:NAD(P)H-dependent oxidoreductase n=1 Tax=unclassified Shewanella TaxID=196818 RepID=UPI0022BA553E|nr:MULTISPECIES: NAD(P)H-dependent oxidoreductase [unclassified Shewanella]MEC4727301.1 NAD(P)H-dependent oxidoreductase [Shewanella sp. D64]MEC4739456.1 NAD(P)H-dependent oxidoreductase [Shewanella sp. E94]WBJ96785.1 NAD(P)H-dependent oxidoreductase [Shewanella sp. MTB7]
MNLLIVSGSQRTQSQSAKIANYLSKVATDFTEVSHIELCRHELPFWDGKPESKFAKGNPWPLISQKVKRADAMILITPEWGGMASPILKNFLLMCDNQETAHKPALLISVVSGISGAYPIAELRMNSLKNNKLVALPDHLIIRHVAEVLNEQPDDNIISDSSMNSRDTDLKERIQYCLHMLYQYAAALSTIREKHQFQPYPKQQEYIYGM